MTEFVAYTVIEGEWPFTRSATPCEAIKKLLDAISWRRVLSIPLPENTITAVVASVAEDDDWQEARL